MQKIVRALLFACAGFVAAPAEEPVPPTRLIDAHTAGVLPKGRYAVEGRVYSPFDKANGTGLLCGVEVGVTDRFSLGIGYGGEGIVGQGRNARFDPFPGCLVKIRLFDENYFLPGMALGFDYQGFGGIAESGEFGYRGYIHKSQGFFAAFSKSYLFFRKIALGLHGAVNFSLEEIDRVDWPDAWAGADLGLGEAFSLVAEYDFGLNTTDPRGAGGNRYARPQDGYLNAGVRWNISDNLAVEFDGRDLLEHRYTKSGRPVRWSREMKIVYLGQI